MLATLDTFSASYAAAKKNAELRPSYALGYHKYTKKNKMHPFSVAVKV